LLQHFVAREFESSTQLGAKRRGSAQQRYDEAWIGRQPGLPTMSQTC
jgi:hypothetical protein